MVKPGRKMRLGAVVRVRDIEGTVEHRASDGERLIEFRGAVDLDAAGELPLPPYFGRPSSADAERYQTVYARERGAVAAPTAGLHFTPEILARVPHAFLTRHVGVGTFRPVQVDDLTQHLRMHAERFHVSEESASPSTPRAALVAVGTTTVRVLESPRPAPAERPLRDNGHFPPPTARCLALWAPSSPTSISRKSTLLMLISAFAGREFILEAYAEAIRERYRFYSYGDCMLMV